MKVSEQWLREWVNPNLEIKQIANIFTMAGLEIDSILPVAAAFDKVVVGQVVAIEQHPAADKLRLCQVDIGADEPLAIVCGASNVAAGKKVAVAVVGAHLPGDVTIKPVKLRGEASAGMLCAKSELGIEDSDSGIWLLPDDAPIGQCLREYAQLDDVTLEVDLTPNRGDCLSVRGLARELSVLCDTPWQDMPVPLVPASHQQLRTLHLEVPSHCSHYCGRVVTNVNAALPSPLWLQERLRRSGIKPKSVVVDITNYVMLELGQPMHAFDNDKLSGDIVVRMARPDESLTLLDSQTITLNESTLVIADADKPLALAGVMGGEHSAVTDSTETVFLESAFFAPEKLAGVGRLFGISSDSSHRFERGVSPDLQALAIERASMLLCELAGGECGPLIEQRVDSALPALPSILFTPANVARVLGVNLPETTMLSYLKRLGMTVVAEADCFKVTVPVYRFDIQLEACLIEEIGRMIGYDQIPLAPIVAPMSAVFQREACFGLDSLRQVLVERGYNETISYSFVSPGLQEKVYGDKAAGLNLVNPLSVELSQMRMGLWPGLLLSAKFNQNRQLRDFKLFETGVVFQQAADGQLSQTEAIAGLCSGRVGDLQWNDAARALDFFDIKGDVEALLGALSDYRFVASTHHALHPGQTAAIYRKDSLIGWVGNIHPNLAKSLDLEGPILLFELLVEPTQTRTLPRFQPLSKFPSIRRDLALIMDEGLATSVVVEAIYAEADSAWLKSIDIFDVYQGDGIAEGKKSVAIALILQHSSRTLIENEIRQFLTAILNLLKQRFDITLRE